MNAGCYGHARELRSRGMQPSGWGEQGELATPRKGSDGDVLQGCLLLQTILLRS